MVDSTANVVRSPRLAAMGVATLSGLMLYLRDSTITPIITDPVWFGYWYLCLSCMYFVAIERLCYLEIWRTICGMLQKWFITIIQKTSTVVYLGNENDDF